MNRGFLLVMQIIDMGGATAGVFNEPSHLGTLH